MERALVVIVCSAVMVAVLHGCLFSVFYPYPSYSSVSSPLRTE